MKISEIRTMLTIMDNFVDEMPLNLIQDTDVTSEELAYVQNCHLIVLKQKEKLKHKGLTKFSYVSHHSNRL